MDQGLLRVAWMGGGAWGVFFALLLSLCAYGASPQEIDLAGTWRVRLDAADVGRDEGWYGQAFGDEAAEVVLPGSLNANGLGDAITAETDWTGTLTSLMWHQEERFAKYREPGNVKILFWLQPDQRYVGPAWYQREVVIPESFAGKHITLGLERCHWLTELWVDGRHVGTRDSLSVPHEYDVGPLMAPGAHTVTLRVDNRVHIEVGPNAHSVSDNTQTNWNGVIGAMTLSARAAVHISDVQVYPDIDANAVRVKAVVANRSGATVSGTLRLVARGPDGYQGEELAVPVAAGVAEGLVEATYAMGPDVRYWSEFSPALYTLHIVLEAGGAEDAREVVFGMRRFATEGGHFTINGQKTFLRGTLECCIFPRTGYPPADVDEWLRILGAAKAHGLNHLRFHSWCPPEAAFVAADRLGFYFQVEGPFWTRIGDGKPIDAYIYAESERILKAYGNHPSFCMMAYGNEPGGKKHAEFLAGLVSHLAASDPRRLYTGASAWPELEENAYFVTYRPRIHSPLYPEGCRIKTSPFETLTDYRDFVAPYDVPIVSHEIGQWCVFPNLEEIPKYSGPLKPRNFEIVRDLLEENGLLDQAKDFLMASGKLQALCYKEEIEAALRTPGMGGFQLLDLHDFPGQGTALVGVLDPFWESKGYISAEAFRRFCGPTVPLLRMARCVFTANEVFEADIEITHFGSGALEGAKPVWRILDPRGGEYAAGALPSTSVPLGNATPLGRIAVPLDGVAAPAKLRVEVALAGTAVANDWEIWVYPERLPETPAEDVHVVEQLDENAVALLEGGAKVLLLPARGTVRVSELGPVPSGFPPIFWNTFWFPGQALRTLGLLCVPGHPALEDFPTDFHSNWQWWDLLQDAQNMTLTPLPAALRPFVQVIDDWNTCRKLGLAFEARVGAGKLLVCSANLARDIEERPVARQLRHSLLKYMASERFAPSVPVSVDALQAVFVEPGPLARLGASAWASSQQAPHTASMAIDGNPSTFWHTNWTGAVARHPHWISLDLSAPVMIRGIAVVQRQDMSNGHVGRASVYVSDSREKWGFAVARGDLSGRKDEQLIRFDEAKRGRYLRVTVSKPRNAEHPWAALAELRPLIDEAEVD